MGGWAPLGTGLCQAGGMDQQLCTGGRASPPGHGLSLGSPSSSPSMGVRGSPGNRGLCSQHGAQGRESLGCSLDPRALPSCISSGSRMSPVVRGGLRGPHPLGSVPGVSAGGSPGIPKSQKDATTSPNPSHGFSAPCGALPPPHPALLCALGRGEAPPERLAWQLLWQPHIFLGIPNDLLAFAVIYSFFFFRLSEVDFPPLWPRRAGASRAVPQPGSGWGSCPGAAPFGHSSVGSSRDRSPLPTFVQGRGQIPAAFIPG